MTKEERLQKQRARLVEMKVREAELHEEGYELVAGVDEVGRGPLAGPVLAAAVVLPDDFDVLGVDDSRSFRKKGEMHCMMRFSVVQWVWALEWLTNR